MMMVYNRIIDFEGSALDLQSMHDRRVEALLLKRTLSRTLVYPHRAGLQDTPVLMGWGGGGSRGGGVGNSRGFG